MQIASEYLAADPTSGTQLLSCEEGRRPMMLETRYDRRLDSTPYISFVALYSRVCRFTFWNKTVKHLNQI